MQPIAPVDTLKKAYKDVYDSLMAICQNYEPEEPEESDDYYSNQFDSSSKSEGKKKEAPARPARNQQPMIISNSKKEAGADKVPNPKNEKNEEIQMIKEEIFEPQFEKFEAPVFLNNEAP